MYLLNVESKEWLCYFMIENYNNSKLLEDLLIIVNKNVNKKNKIKKRKILFVLLKIKHKIESKLLVKT